MLEFHQHLKVVPLPAFMASFSLIWRVFLLDLHMPHTFPSSRSLLTSSPWRDLPEQLYLKTTLHSIKLSFSRLIVSILTLSDYIHCLIYMMNAFLNSLVPIFLSCLGFYCILFFKFLFYYTGLSCFILFCYLFLY